MPPDRFDLSRVFDPDPAAPGKMYTRWGGFVDGIDQFDAGFFGFSRREAVRIDPQHRMLLEVAWEALEDAGLRADRLAGSATGVFVGISTHDYGDFQAQPQTRAIIDAHTNSGGAGSIAANRISYVYDFRGPSFVVDTACSSSLTALHLACQSLRSGECSLALAGGVQAVLAPELTIGFCKASMISPDGRCKAFAAEGNGYVRGEGAGLVALKPLSHAIADGDRVYAVVRGTAINEDGRTNGMTVPGLWSQQAVLRQAYQQAGIAPGAVHYVEAHGPGTAVGDPIEAEALATVLACERPAGEVLRIGSVKTNIGHLEAASGIAGLIKAALVATHRHIPASLHFKTPNPAIPFSDYRLRVVAEPEAWPDGAPVYIGINSFGFGGANAHVVLEGPPSQELPHQAAVTANDVPRETLLFLSARGPESLLGLARSYRARLLGPDVPPIADLAAAAAAQRAHHDHRLAVVGRDADQLADNLDAYLNQETRADVATGRALHSRPPRVVFVFAGMGPQWWGMGRQLLASEPVFRDVIEQCDRLIRRHADWSLIDELMRDQAESRVAEADLAQPVNFAFQAALLALWCSWGVEPAAVVGHSAGEIAAVYATGALDLGEAVRVAFYRGLLQHRATGKGRMLAVGQGIEATQSLVDDYAGRVSVAAINSPLSVTLSGDADAIEAINAVLQARGVFSRVMAVQVPYHSHHMNSIEGDLLEALAGLTLRAPAVPIVSEVTGEWAGDTTFDAAYWWRNIRQPVLFGAAVQTLIAEGHDLFLEVSPHPVLGQSVNECLAAAGAAGVALPSLRRNESDRAMMLRAVGGLATRGVDVRWETVIGPPRSRVPLPLYPWHRERVWLDAPASAREEDSASDTGILGHRVRAVQPQWEVNLASPALAYIGDHRIHGAIVFPGAGYVAMGLEMAAAVAPAPALVLEDIEFRKALFVPEGIPLHLQALYEPASRQVRMHAESAPGGDAWSLHAACRLAAAPAAAAAPADFDAIRARCARPLSHDEFYAEVAQRGFTFGPRFMGIEQLVQGDGEALGHVRLPADHAVRVDGYRMHPALLDAGLQVLIAAVMTRERPHEGRWPAFLPTRASRVTSYDTAGTAFWSHATVQSATAEGFEGTVAIYAEDGRPLLVVEGLTARTLEDVSGAGRVPDYLYQLRWTEQPPRVAPLEVSAPWCQPDAAAAAVNARADALSRETGFFGYYDEVEVVLDRATRAFFARALASLAGTGPDAAFVPGALPDGTPLTGPRQRHWAAMLAALDAAGTLVSAADGRRRWAQPGVAADDPQVLLQALRTTRQSYASVCDLVERCGMALADVVTGRRGAPEVLFSGDGIAAMTTFYRDAPSCRLFNTLTADAVAAALATFPVGRDLRVLEIGAGTGAATREVLPRLTKGQTAYTFTDISPLFLGLAREDLGTPAFLRYATLDIERDPATQGFEPGSVDLIIASNVVHATTDVARTLRHMTSLLAPGGALVLQEITRRPCWLDLVFGITDGWWAFTDEARRPAHALLDVSGWQHALAEAGFEASAVVREHGHAEPGQAVFVARIAASAVPATSRGAWLVFADRQGVGEDVAAALERRGHPCTLVQASAGPVLTRDASGYQLPLRSADAMAQVLQAVEAEHGTLAGVLHCWSLDMPSASDTLTAEGLLDAQPLGYGSLLDLIHAWETHAHPPRLVLVTAEAQAVEPGRTTVAVTQAPLWGMGRVLLHEYPGYRPRLIDCSAAPDAREIEALALEVLADDREDEVLLRGAARYVHRLVRLDPGASSRVAPSREPAHGRSFRADVGAIGDLQSLTLREITRRPPGPGDIEVEVRAASLNFRDVVFAMGMLPAEAFDNEMSQGALGVDCTGVVSAVGAGVTHVVPGQAVMALGPAALGTHMMTRDLAVPLPDGVSFSDGAALPLAYVTAIYALETLGRIRRGERVLIHAATGGVGLAAVAVARRVGAEIFATAGSDAKRDHLRALGVTHVMNSRTTDFAAEVLAATGGRGVDLVLNSLSGQAIAQSLAVLAPRGRFLEIGKSDIYRRGDLPLEAFRRNLSYFAIQIDSLFDRDRQELLDVLQQVRHGIADGSLPLLPVEVFSIDALEDAMRTMSQARHIGKLVVAIDRPDIPIEPPSSAGRPLFRPDASYLITGGRGGVGVALARWAAAEGARHLVLVGRRASADAEADDVRTLRESGVDVRLLDGDISRPEEARRVIEAADRAETPLRGVFHSAMVIDDAPLSELDEARFATVLRPKAAGAWNLHLATRDRPLDHFVLFSSITSIYGNRRQGNYGAANAFLDALAGYRRAHGRPGLTVNWGVFSDAGYVAARPELGEYLARQGQYGLDAGHAFAAMASCMTHGVVQGTIARTDWPVWTEANPDMGASPRFRDLLRSRDDGAGAASAGHGRVLDALLAADAAARPPEVLQHLRRRVAKILGTAPDRVEPTVPLTEMGMDSLMAVELMTALKNDIGIDIPAVKLLQGATADQLAVSVLEHLGALAAPALAGTSAPRVEAAPAVAPAAQLPAPAEPPAALPAALAAAASVSAPPLAAAPAAVLPSPPVSAAAPPWTPFQAFARSVVSGVIDAVADLQITGLEHVPQAGPVVIAANHISRWDAPILLRMAERRTVIFAAEELRRFPWLHWTLHGIWDAIYLKRGEADVDAVAQALDVLRSGAMIGLSPEGMRVSGGLGRAQTGVAHLAQRSGAPVLPIALWGQEHIPQALRRVSRARVEVRIGAPMPPPAGELTGLAMRVYTDRVMTTIAAMLPEEYRGVYAEGAAAPEPSVPAPPHP